MKQLLKLHFFVLLALAFALIPATAQDAEYLRGPYLAQSTPRSVVVVWRTGSATQPIVRIGASPQRLDRIITGNSIKVRTMGQGAAPLAVAPTGAVQFEANITGLTPATKYYYAVYDGAKLIAGGDSYHFTTHPPVAAKTPFRFWVVGDSGTGGTDQARVHDAMRAYVARQNRPLDFYLHVGDMAYNSGTDPEFQRNFFAPYDATLRNTVCWPSMGNHEGRSSNGKIGVGPYHDAYVTPTRGEAGGLASGTEAYYSFDYANAHFICLNSHDLDRSPAGAMARWLKADLEATRADWIVAFWHHPPYTKGSHDSDREEQLIEMRQNIMPILESAGVDLVLTGHSHIYERSMLIDGAYGTPTVAENFVLDDGDGNPVGDGAYRKSAGLNPHEGAVQVVAGHGGTGLRRGGTMPVMKRVFLEHGSVIVDVAGDTLTAIMLNADGVQRDLFSIVKRGKVSPQRIANPKQLPPYVKIESLALMTALQLPRPGVVAQAALDFQKIPANLAAKNPIAQIAWDTTGTSWQIAPKEAVISLSAESAAQQPFSVSYNGEIFPLPTAKIAYNFSIEEGETATEISLPLTLMPYKRAPLAAMQTVPTIDGVLTPTELDGLARQTDLITHVGTGAAKHPTEFYTGLRDNKLYLAVINHEPAMNKMSLLQRDFDGPLWQDDSLEIFVQREGDPDYYQFIVNAAGQRFDSRSGKSAWNGQWSTASRREKDRWISETLISLDMLGAPVKVGEVLRFNLTRNNYTQGEWSQWSYTNRTGNLTPEYFGRLIVGGK